MNNSFKIYLDDTIALARSLIIKLDSVADAMNTKANEYGLEVEDDKSTWRYYMHLAGDYHQLDESMSIVSLDTSDVIPFNKETLKLHKKTFAVYKNNIEYIEQLISRYPEQSLLIRSVIDPIDYTVSIPAKGGSILNYDTNMVELQEISLIGELEKEIQKFLYQYDMKSFAETDDLFVSAMTGILATNIVTKIQDIRAKNIKTSQTHSFHMIAYLASNYGIDSFVPFLTLPQILYLYHNIKFIERRSGHKEVFNVLINRLMTWRNLPVYSYDLIQKDMDIEEGNLYPSAIFSKNPVNFNVLSGRDIDEWSIDTVMQKQAGLATNNHDTMDDYLIETDDLVSTARVSKLPTKLLEVFAVDIEAISPIKLVDVLINEWIHMSATGRYVNVADLINPINGENMRLDTRELFLVFAYGTLRGKFDITPDVIPPFMAYSIQDKTYPDDNELLAAVHNEPLFHWDKEINFFNKTHTDVDDLIVTSYDFFSIVRKLTQHQRARLNYVYNASRYTESQGRRAMYDIIYKDQLCTLNIPTISTFDDFFLALGLDANLMSNEDWLDLSQEALDAATGYTDNNDISIQQIQAAIVKLFKRLSSYTIQFIEESEDARLEVPLGFYNALGNTQTETKSRSNLNLISNHITPSGKSLGKCNSDLSNTIISVSTPPNPKVSVDLTMGASLISKRINRNHIPLSPFTVTSLSDING